MATKKAITKNIAIIVSIIVIILSLPAGIYVYYLDRIYPNVFINNIDVGGKTANEAVSLLAPKISTPQSITLKYNNNTYNVDINSLNISFDKNKTIKRALELGRSGNIIFDFQNIAHTISNKVNYPIELSLNNQVLDNFIDKLNNNIYIAPINAKFEIANNKVQSFAESTDGLEINKVELKKEILEAINSKSSEQISLTIPTTKLVAQIQTSDVNNLGLKELVGSGTSHFAGSISSRIFNVNLAASRINNTLIAPGETFSFDKTVGDISALNGYQQAYVIQNGQTVLGDGGGVCQVSTTMFRAALDSGLPITERHAHAYRVHYYEEDADPGMDATIYTPTVDFKFKNDLTSYILIQTQIDLKNLVLTFNFYGTKDGRVAAITKPKLWDASPAPEPLYTDDPTLPVGQIKQIDFAAPGLKSQFDYTVTKDGKEINKQTFFSNFKPWQAKYLRGTKV